MKALLKLEISNALSPLLSGLVLVCLLLTSGYAEAQGNTELVTRRRIVKPSEKFEVKSWTLPVALERSSTLHSESSYERVSYTVLSLAPSYRLNKDYTLGARTLIYKQEDSVGNSGLDNTSITISRSFKQSKRLSYSLGFGIILPTDQNLREATSYQGGARTSGSVQLADLYLGSSLTYSLILSRNVHEYNQTAEGAFNVQTNATQAVSYVQPLSKSISLSTSFSYSYGWTYLNDSRTKFAMGADLNWQATNAFGIYVGTSNEGNALKPNGSDSNIEFYNDNSSILKVGLNYVI